MKAFLLAALLMITTQVFATGANIQKVSQTLGSNGAVSTVLVSKYLYSFYYSVASNAGATIVLERSGNGGVTWSTVLTFTNTTGAGVIKNEDVGSAMVKYRFRVTAYTSGSPTVKLNELPFYPNGKAGKRVMVPAMTNYKFATSNGFSSNVNTSSLITLPASKTDAKLLINLPQLPVGSVIKAFNLVGQVESGGNNISMDATIASALSVSGDVVETSEESMTRFSSTTDDVLGYTNTEKILAAPLVVYEDMNLFLILTGTTGSATDVALQGVVIEYDEP